MRKTHAALLSACSIAASLMIGCRDVGEPLPYDPRALQQNERLSAIGRKPEPMRQLPTTLPGVTFGRTRSPDNIPVTGEPLGTNEEIVRMTLQECVHRAVANNLDIRVAGYGPAIESSRVVEAMARFDPTFFTNINGQYQNQQTAGSIINNFDAILHNQPGGTIISYETVQEQYQLQTGIKQDLPSGGQAKIQFQTQRSDIDPRSFVKNPYVQDDLLFQLTQPLLRDFGTEVNRARIDIARNTQQISVLDLRKQAEESISKLEETYWQLYEAEQDVLIQEELLNQSNQTGDVLSSRLGTDVSRVQIAQTSAAAEERRAGLARVHSHVRDLSDQLKALMSDPDYTVSGSILILPADAPTEEEIQFDPEEQINQAMENRFELGQDHYKIGNASITVNAARNNLFPQLNLVASAGAEGLREDFDTALNEMAQFNHLNYAVGFEFEVPIGNRAARSIWRRSLLQRQQAIDAYRGQQVQITAEVTQAMREVHTTWNEIIGNRKSKFAYADALRGLQQREGTEPLTYTFVQLKLDIQERYADAKRLEAQALARYNIAVAALERAKGTLLRYNNILLEEETYKRQLARP
jgi:outer membrane protein